MTRGRLLIALLALAIGCLLLAGVPGDALPPCPFRTITGYDCPFCGGTRCVRRLIHGNITGAADMNLLVLVVLPFAVYAYASGIALAFAGRTLPTPKLPSWTWYAVAAAALLFAVLRNLPYGPVAWMASYR